MGAMGAMGVGAMGVGATGAGAMGAAAAGAMGAMGAMGAATLAAAGVLAPSSSKSGSGSAGGGTRGAAGSRPSIAEGARTGTSGAGAAGAGRAGREDETPGDAGGTPRALSTTNSTTTESPTAMASHVETGTPCRRRSQLSSARGRPDPPALAVRAGLPRSSRAPERSVVGRGRAPSERAGRARGVAPFRTAADGEGGGAGWPLLRARSLRSRASRRCCRLDLEPPRLATAHPSWSALAPPMISISSVVIAAWRARLYCRVSLPIISSAFLVAASIAVMRAPSSEAIDS